MAKENESLTNLINENGIFKDDIRIEAIGWLWQKKMKV